MNSMKTEIIPENLKDKKKKPAKGKPKIGIYALTSCYGCQLKMATLSQIVDIVNSIDLVSFSMLSSASRLHDEVDIAFVEGSVSTEMDLKDLKEIREKSTLLVGIGACALQGGVQSWSEGEATYEELYTSVYGTGKINYRGLQATPIDKHVKVDFRLPGCPPEEDEIVYFISTFLFKTWPEEKDYPVCQECRIVGNPCILIERGAPCLGPVTTAGCDARCLTFNVPCIGCRGPVPNETAWFDSLAKTFKDKGLTEKMIYQRMRIFGAHDATLPERLKKIFGEYNNG